MPPARMGWEHRFELSRKQLSVRLLPEFQIFFSCVKKPRGLVICYVICISFWQQENWNIIWGVFGNKCLACTRKRPIGCLAYAGCNRWIARIPYPIRKVSNQPTAGDLAILEIDRITREPVSLLVRPCILACRYSGGHLS